MAAAKKPAKKSAGPANAGVKGKVPGEKGKAFGKADKKGAAPKKGKKK